jgi:hypothetical protein
MSLHRQNIPRVFFTFLATFPSNFNIQKHVEFASYDVTPLAFRSSGIYALILPTLLTKQQNTMLILSAGKTTRSSWQQHFVPGGSQFDYQAEYKPAWLTNFVILLSLYKCNISKTEFSSYNFSSHLLLPLSYVQIFPWTPCSGTPSIERLYWNKFYTKIDHYVVKWVVSSLNLSLCIHVRF